MGILYQIALYLASIIFILSGEFAGHYSLMGWATFPIRIYCPNFALDGAKSLWENEKVMGLEPHDLE